MQIDLCVRFDWSTNPILLKIDIHLHYTMMHVWNNWFFSKLLLAVANLCNLPLFANKFVLSSWRIHVRYTKMRVWNNWFFFKISNGNCKFVHLFISGIIGCTTTLIMRSLDDICWQIQMYLLKPVSHPPLLPWWLLLIAAIVWRFHIPGFPAVCLHEHTLLRGELGRITFAFDVGSRVQEYMRTSLPPLK